MTIETAKKISETEVFASATETVKAEIISEEEKLVSSTGDFSKPTQRVTSSKTSGHLFLRYAPPESSGRKTSTML